MSWLKYLAVVGLLVVDAGVGVAGAADMPGEMPPPVLSPPPPISFNYGWYVRGDIGYAFGALGGARSAPGFSDPHDNRLDNGLMGGIGAGIKTRWLRTDITIDYTSPLTYTGSVAAPDDTTAKVAALAALFNGYVDLGTWYNFTPYIGGGIGAAQIRVSDYASPAAPPFAAGTSKTQYGFAWALTGGVGYQVAPNIVVDASYRYVNYGDVVSASDPFGDMTLTNVAAHEVRLGIRWSFDDFSFIH
jgi:opacity protein-like surface antigen